MMSTDTPTPSVGTYTASLRRRDGWTHYNVGTFGTWKHSRGQTHSGGVAVSVTSQYYYMYYTGSGNNNHYAGTYYAYQQIH